MYYLFLFLDIFSDNLKILKLTEFLIFWYDITKK